MVELIGEAKPNHLDDDQWEAVKKVVSEPTKAALIASTMGSGKTRVAVEVGKRIGASIVIVVAPLFTRSGWERTIKEQIPDVVTSRVDSSRSGQLAMERLLSGEAGWYIFGREYFASKSTQVRLRDGKESLNWDLVIYDECQKFANRKSAGFAWMKKIKPKFKIAMSGTPFRNKFSGMWAIHQWLWPRLEGHASFWTWAATYCETKEDYFGGTVIVGEKNPGEFVSKLPCYIRTVVNHGPVEENVITFDLSPKERKIYDQFEKRLIVFLEENKIVAKVPAVKRIRLRQMTLGEVIVDPDDDSRVGYSKNMKSTKYDILTEIIGIHEDQPMLIFTDSQPFAHVVADKLQDRGLNAVAWTGKESAHQRETIRRMFIDGEVDYIIATPASIGEGTDGLQDRCHIMVWLSKSDDGVYNDQAFHRLVRRGQTKTVVSYVLEANDTYDNGQFSRLITQTLDNNKILRSK